MYVIRDQADRKGYGRLNVHGPLVKVPEPFVYLYADRISAERALQTVHNDLAFIEEEEE